MASLIRRITALSAANYGVNILEQAPPGVVQGAQSAVVGVVGWFPWGPRNTVTEISSPRELFDTFCPLPFDVTDDWAAMKAFLNKTFPAGLKVVNIEPSGAAAADFDFVDASADESVTVTAKYKGSVGNSIKVAWTANADDATARDATVTIGSLYSVTYKAVATIVSTALVVTDPGDPFVTFSKFSGATLVPAAISATSLSGGADGTEAAADYTGSGKGLLKFYGESVDVDILFVAEPGSSFIADINTGIEAYVNTNEKGMAILCTPAAQSKSTARTYVADYRSERLVYTWPRVKTTNLYDPLNAEVTVDGAAFAAAALAGVAPEVSPGGAPGAPFLTGITGLEDETATAADMDTLNEYGVTPWMMNTALGGAIMRKAMTTSLTSGRTRVFRRRMTDFIVESLSARWEQFAEAPLDLTLSTQTLGPNSGQLVAETVAFLEQLKADGRIREYAVDPWSENSSGSIADGTWVIVVTVGLFSAMDNLVLKANIGEGVTITAS